MKKRTLKYYSNLFSMFHYLYKYKPYLYGTFFLLSLSATTVLSLGASLKYFTNQGLTGIIALKNSIFFFAILLFILSISSAGRSFLIEFLCNKVCNDIKKDLYSKMISLPPHILESNQLGNINSKINNEVSIIQSVIPTFFSFFIRNLLMLLGGIILLFITSIYLTTVTIILVPLALIPLLIIGRKLKHLSLKPQETTSILTDKIEETVNAIKDIQSNCQENKEISVYSTILSHLTIQIRKQLLVRSVFVGGVILAVSYVIITIFWIGSYQVIFSKIQTGDLVSFIFYSVVVASSLAGMSEVYTDINKAAGAADRICNILNIETKNTTPYQNIKNFNIEFKNISFAYPKRKKTTINNLSFTIKEGERVAIIGPSGIGKTTILELLLKFYKPNEGDIFIGEHNLKDIDTTQLRHIISYVAQDPYIFEATLQENLKYGNNKASQKELEEIITKVNLNNFLQTLPNGFNTVLYKKAANLSGGQKHRIALARALLRKSNILLLDEITNGLDDENESLICELLKKEKRTVILVTHKQALINICNKVIKIKS